VFDPGFRDIEAAPAGPLSAEAEVGVFAIEEEVFREEADFVEHCGAVNGGTPAGQESFLRLGEELRVLAVAALFGTTVAGDQHAGRVQAIGAGQRDAGGGHAGMRVPQEGGDGGFQPARVGNGVVIEGGEEGGGGEAVALIDGGAEAEVFAIFDEAEAEAGCAESMKPARAAIVDDDDLDAGQRLSFEGSQTIQEPVVSGHRRDDDCNLS